MSMIRPLLAALLVLASVGVSSADDQYGFRVYTKAAKFDDVRDDVKEAIEKRGFVIDYVGKFNTMLERTAEAAGSITATGAKSPYKNAEFLQFCPAKLTHEAVSANALAIANCPIAVYVFETGQPAGTITVGFRHPVGSPSKAVKAVNEKLIGLLDDIAREVTK